MTASILAPYLVRVQSIPSICTRVRERRMIRCAVGSLLVSLVTLLLPGVGSAQQAPASGSQPFAPDWAMFAGGEVFAKKGCGRCHSVRGVGGGVGPDLASAEAGKGFFDIGAAMWNHLPLMGAQMRQQGIERPRMTAREMSNVIAFIFTLQYFDELGDPKAGEALFTQKGCVQCHSVGGKGGHVGPALDPLKRANSPVLVAAAMWSHGPRMAEVMKQRGIARPTFQGKELLDIIAYIATASSDTSTETLQVAPGTPERGQKLFAERQCAACHAINGKGGKIGPDLGRPGHQSLTRFAEDMWNHAPAMWARMAARGIAFNPLTGQEMADIVAYLYVARYFDALGDAAQGAQLVQRAGCLTCHSVAGKGGKIAADFTTSRNVTSPSGLIAGMWNHAPLMEAQVQRQQIKWPTLSGQDLADVSAYLRSIWKGDATKSRTP